MKVLGKWESSKKVHFHIRFILSKTNAVMSSCNIPYGSGWVKEKWVTRS